MAQVFTLPDLGEGLTEASLVRWLVDVGDEIAVDQPVAEVETAKSVVEVPSPFGGVVETLHGAEGDALVVGEPLLTVSATSAATEGSGNVLVGYGTSDAPHTGRRRRRRASSADPGGRARWSPGIAQRSATPAPSEPASEGSSEERARVSRPGDPVLGPATLPTGSPGLDTAASGLLDHRDGGPIAVISPVVRQLAKTGGLDLATVHGSGASGVITRHDVEAALASAASDTDQRTGLTVRSTTPFSLFRKTVAANMSRSRSEIPEATVWVDVDATDLYELRRRIRVGDKHPSLLTLVARFTVAALKGYPMLAGRLGDDGTSLIEFDGVNLGFAADTPRGLVVPVVRHADALSLRVLDAELSRLTDAARGGRATPAELTGSTFTINNYGSLGVDGSAAIINHPEVAILGIGRMLERPWVVDGQIVPRRIVQLSLVFDHRVCDGGTAAGFLRAIADAVEHPFDAFADF